MFKIMLAVLAIMFASSDALVAPAMKTSRVSRSAIRMDGKGERHARAPLPARTGARLWISCVCALAISRSSVSCSDPLELCPRN
jgi:hypothetical protein